MANRETITDCRDTSYVQFSTDTTVYTVKTVGTVCEAAKKPHAKSIAVRYRGTRTKRTEIAMIRYMEQLAIRKSKFADLLPLELGFGSKLMKNGFVSSIYKKKTNPIKCLKLLLYDK